MLTAIDISTSALVAQRVRLNAIASNIANLNTTRNEAGQPAPYERRYAVFQTDDRPDSPYGAAGVKVRSIEIEAGEPIWKLDPNHQDAVREGPRKGFVAYPNINLATEMVDSMQATHAYQANIGAIEVTKNMTQQTLRILA